MLHFILFYFLRSRKGTAYDGAKLLSRTVSACCVLANDSLLSAFNMDNVAGSIWSHFTHNIDRTHPVSWWETVLSFCRVARGGGR